MSQKTRSLKQFMKPYWVCVAWSCWWVLPSITHADGRAAADAMMESSPVETAMTTVVGVSGPEITLGAGSRDGIGIDTEVTLLREGEPIIHPLTGQILGVPQEPVGLVHVFEVEEQSARARLVKNYSEPMIDDLAEYMRVVVKAPEPDVKDVVNEFAKRVTELESSVQDYEKANENLTKSYPAFARRIWDEISAMRSYMVSLDERLVELEEQQDEDHARLASVLIGEYRPEDLKEFTIKYTPDTQIKLQASGKTLLISVVNDSVRMERPTAGMHDDLMSDVTVPPPMEDEDGDGIMATIQLWFEGGEDDVEDGVVMSMSDDEAGEAEADGDSELGGLWLWVAAGGLLVALLIMAILLIKRRYKDVMDWLDEFDDEYLDDEEDSEDYDEEEY